MPTFNADDSLGGFERGSYTPAQFEDPINRQVELNTPIREEPSTFDVIGGAFGTTSTGFIIRNLNEAYWASTIEADPNWTVDVHRDYMKEALKQVSPDFVGGLQSARSPEEFNYRLEKAKAIQQAYADAGAAGSFPLQALVMMIHMADAPAVAVGAGATVGILKGIHSAIRLGKLPALGAAANLALGGAAGAAGGITSEAFLDMVGGLSETEAYLFSGLLGALGGAALGPHPIARSGEWAAVTSRLVQRAKGIGNDTGLVGLAQRFKAMKSPVQAEAGGVPAAAPRPATPPAQAPAPSPSPARATVEVGGSRASIEVPPEVGAAVGRQFGFPGEATPSTAARQFDEATGLNAPDEDVLVKMADLEADIQNLKHVGTYQLGDAEFKIRAAEENGQGPYTVAKKTKNDRWRTLKDEFESVEEAKAAMLLDRGAGGKVSFRDATGETQVLDGTSTTSNKQMPDGRRKSQGTVYVDQKLASEFEAATKAQPEGTVGVRAKDGNLTLQRLEDGLDIEGSTIPYGDIPKKGLVPVQLLDDGRTARMGAPIEEVMADAVDLADSAGAMRNPDPGKGLYEMVGDEMGYFYDYAGANPRTSGNWVKDMMYKWQFTRQGLLENSPNQFVARIASLFTENPVGMLDGSPVPISAETMKEVGLKNVMGRLQSAWIPQLEDYMADLKISKMNFFEARDEFMENVTSYTRESDKEAVKGDYHPQVINASKAMEKELDDYIAKFKEAGFDWAEQLEDAKGYLTRQHDAPFIHEGVNTGKWVVHSKDPTGPAQGMEKVYLAGMEKAHDDALAKNVAELTKRGQADNIIYSGDGSVIFRPDPEDPDNFSVLRLSDKQIRMKARTYVNHVARRSMGLGNDFDHFVVQGDQKAIREMLEQAMDETNIKPSEKDMMMIIESLAPGVKGRKNFADFTMKRALIDENVPVDIGGRTMSVKDFLTKDAERIMSTYVNRAEGMLAMSKVKFVNPATGNVMINGIRNRQDWEEQVIKPVREYAALAGPGVNEGGRIGRFMGEDVVEQLEWQYRRLMGVPEKHYSSGFANFVRTMRQIQGMRLLSNVGIAQAGETGTPAGALGLRAFFGQKAARGIPGKINAQMRAADDPRLIAEMPFVREAEAAYGLPAPRLQGGYYNIAQVVDGTDVPFEWAQHQKKGFNILGRNVRPDRWLHMGEELTYRYSGMKGIMHEQQLYAVGAMTERVLRDVTDKNLAGLTNRLKAYGINTDKPKGPVPKGLAKDSLEYREATMSMLERIQHEMVENAEFVPSATSDRVKTLRLDKWKDLQAKFVWEHAMSIMSRKLIQNGVPSQAAIFMDNNMARLIFMFRSFALSAWSNQLLHNIHMGDWRTVATGAYTMSMAALLRTAQVHVQAINRSDRDEYLDKYLSRGELAKAAFQRAGWSSIIPMINDSTLGALGISPVGSFNARISGQATDAVFGSPTASHFNSLQRGLKGAMSGEMTQSDARALKAALLPWGNFFLFSALLNPMIEGLPERRAKSEDTFYDEFWQERAF